MSSELKTILELEHCIALWIRLEMTVSMDLLCHQIKTTNLKDWRCASKRTLLQTAYCPILKGLKVC
jgi:hypothetical protein